MNPSWVAQMVKNLLAMQETWAQSLGWEDSPGEGNGNPLQYSCLENPMDRGVWQTTHMGLQSRTLLRRLSTHSLKCQKMLNVMKNGHTCHLPNTILQYFGNYFWYLSPCVCISHSVASNSVAYQTSLFMEFSRQEY